MSNNYRSIAKANVLFGGVQVYNILISIIRSKIVAVLLGPEGMGIMGLFNSTLDLVKSATNMGLQTSAVREVALAGKEENAIRVSEVGYVLSQLVWCTGFLGVIVTFLFAPYLSDFAFNSREYTIHFRILSVTLLIYQLTVHYNVLLQGMRRLRLLAQANVIGSTVGLVIIMPLFYFWKYDAIMPSIIISALILYLSARFSARNLKFSPLSMQWKEVFVRGKQMMLMGVLLSLTGFMDVIVSYLVKIAITQWGSIAEVGLYNAGYSMVLSYVGLVFTSIGTDYFPRLSAVSGDKLQYNQLINQQFELMVLVLTPLILLFIAFSPYLLQLLYSSKFTGISIMICWLTSGMIFRAIAWCPGFMYIARNDTKLYLVIYIITIAVELVLFIGSYYLMGLDGLGISFLLMNILNCASSVIITKWKYGCEYSRVSYRLMILSVTAIAICLAVSYWEHIGRFVIYALITIPFCVFSIKELDKRLDIIQLLKRKISK